MMSKNNLIILIFSFIVSFFASYESKKYKLEVYFGNNLKNYYQIENMYKFKNDDMIFDYAASENFKVIIYTNNLDKAHRASELMETGTVAVNTGVVALPEAPFGGIKQTGYGREGGSMAIKDYLNIKYTHFGISCE